MFSVVVESALWVIGSLAVGAVLALGVSQWRLLAYLKDEHPQQWLALGSPQPWWPAGREESRVKVGRFVWSREYQQLQDSRAQELGRISRAAAMTLIVLFLLWVALFITETWFAA